MTRDKDAAMMHTFITFVTLIRFNRSLGCHAKAVALLVLGSMTLLWN